METRYKPEDVHVTMEPFYQYPIRDRKGNFIKHNPIYPMSRHSILPFCQFGIEIWVHSNVELLINGVKFYQHFAASSLTHEEFIIRDESHYEPAIIALTENVNQFFACYGEIGIDHVIYLLSHYRERSKTMYELNYASAWELFRIMDDKTKYLYEQLI